MKSFVKSNDDSYSQHKCGHPLLNFICLSRWHSNVNVTRESELHRIGLQYNRIPRFICLIRRVHIYLMSRKIEWIILDKYEMLIIVICR